MKKDQAKEKRQKESFLTGMANRAREAMGLGRVLVTEPRAFPGALGKVFKRSVRTLWQARGGGLYACGFVVTFIWLEITTLFEEIASSTSLAGFFSEQFFELILRFTIESLQNTIGAFLWPVYLIQLSPVWGGAILGALYLAFPRYIKEPLTRWLFHDDEQTTAENANQDQPQ